MDSDGASQPPQADSGPQRTPPQSVARRLTIGFGVLVALLAVSGFVSLQLIERIDHDLMRIVEVEEPLQEALLEMEVEAGGTARAVLNYIHLPHARYRHQVLITEEAFEQHAERFNALAETDEERELGQQVAEIYARFKAAGSELMDLSDKRERDLELLRRDVGKIDLLMNQLAPKQGGASSARIETLLRAQVQVERVFAVAEAYVAMDAPEIHEGLDEAVDEAQGFIQEFRQFSNRNSGEEEKLSKLETRLAEVATASREILSLTDRINVVSNELQRDLTAIDTCLDDKVKPLVQQQTRLAASDAMQTSKTAMRVLAALGLVGIVIGGTIGWSVSRGIIRPVNALVNGSRIIGAGDRDHRIELSSRDEFGRLAEAFNGMVENLNRSADDLLKAQQYAAHLKLHAAEQQIEEHATEARTDQLTCISNRRAFDDEMQQRAADYEENGSALAVALFDVDRFKLFNDTYGHQAGDEVLRGVAATLDNAFSAPDFVARFGGEEFAILLPAQTEEEAAHKADQARQAIEDAEFEFDGIRLRVTASGGLAGLAAGEDIESVLRRADEALYAAKDAGRNCVCFHDGNGAESIAAMTATAALSTG